MRAWFRKLCGFFCAAKSLPSDESRAPERSALSSVRESIAISEQVLYHAEKHCRLTEQRYAFGEANEGELWDAHEMLRRAKTFFLLSLYDLDDRIDDLALEGRRHPA